MFSCGSHNAIAFMEIKYFRYVLAIILEIHFGNCSQGQVVVLFGQACLLVRFTCAMQHDKRQ